MTISDSINRMIEFALQETTWTSASPGFTNRIKVLGEFLHPSLEDEFRAIIEEELALSESEALKAPDQLTGGSGSSSELSREVDGISESLSNLKKSPFGDLADITKEQAGNLAGFSKNPFSFMLNNFFKKFAKGAGIVALATIIFAAVQLIILELLKPGRALDRRFRRIAKDEIFLFNSVEEQAELRQGFRTVTVTTMPFLRGADQTRGQVSGNLYNPTAIPMDRIDPRRVAAPLIQSQNSSRGAAFFNRRGRGRRR